MIKEYILWTKIHFKELTEYKVSLYLYLIGNFVYGLSNFFVVLFFFNRIKSLPLYQPILVLFTSFLIFDLSAFIVYGKGFFMSDFFMFIFRPGNEFLSTIYNVWHKIPLIIIEIILISFVIWYYYIPVTLIQIIIYILYVILGAIVFGLLMNTFLLLGGAIFKTDNNSFKYFIRDVNDTFETYPYIIFKKSKILWTLAMIFFVPLYTYNPASMLWIKDSYIYARNILTAIFIIVLLYIAYSYTKKAFHKVFEVYGG